MDYRFCEHCDKRVSQKTFKEHRRLYYHEGEWLTARREEDESSNDSTPLNFSISSDNDSPRSDDSDEMNVDCGKYIRGEVHRNRS